MPIEEIFLFDWTVNFKSITCDQSVQALHRIKFFHLCSWVLRACGCWSGSAFGCRAVAENQLFHLWNDSQSGGNRHGRRFQALAPWMALSAARPFPINYNHFISEIWFEAPARHPKADPSRQPQARNAQLHRWKYFWSNDMFTSTFHFLYYAIYWEIWAEVKVKRPRQSA